MKIGLEEFGGTAARRTAGSVERTSIRSGKGSHASLMGRQACPNGAHFLRSSVQADRPSGADPRVLPPCPEFHDNSPR